MPHQMIPPQRSAPQQHQPAQESTLIEAFATVASHIASRVFLLSSTTPTSESQKKLLSKLTLALSSSSSSSGAPIPTTLIRNPASDFHTAVFEAAHRNESHLAVFLESSETLVEIVPSLHKLVADRVPSAVVHVPVRGAKELDAVLGLRHIGIPIVVSSTPQEAHDIALASHLASRAERAPFIHVYGITSINATIAPISIASAAQIEDLESRFPPALTLHDEEDEDQDANSQQNSDTLKPNPSLYLPARSIPPLDPTSLTSTLASALHALSPTYRPFEFTGLPDSTTVLVTLATTPRAPEDVVMRSLVGGSAGRYTSAGKRNKIGVLRVRVLRPWSDEEFWASLPRTVKRVAVLEEVDGTEGSEESNVPIGPLFMDVVGAFQTQQQYPERTQSVQVRRAVHIGTGHITGDIVERVFDELETADEKKKLIIVRSDASSDSSPDEIASSTAVVQASSRVGSNPETPYLSILSQLFSHRLHIANFRQASDPSTATANAEIGLGIHLANIRRRNQLIDAVRAILNRPDDAIGGDEELRKALTGWIDNVEDSAKSAEFGGVVTQLVKKKGENASASSEWKVISQEVARGEDENLFTKPSLWLVSSDRAPDTSHSALHHLIASKQDVNILVVDTIPYTLVEALKKLTGSGVSASATVGWRKKDLGLYAMTYGGVYVASIAVGFSYAQAVRAIKEADAFKGPSVVLAYSPDVAIDPVSVGLPATISAPASEEPITETSTSRKTRNRRSTGPGSAPLLTLRETKSAVDSGYWPLYRWNPSLEGSSDQQQPFQLDSEKLRGEIEKFLERENHFAMLINSNTVPDTTTPKPTATIGGLVGASPANTGLSLPTPHITSLQSDLNTSITSKLHTSYTSLLSSLSSKPLLVLYGSDGGNAEKLARRLARESKPRGLRPRVMSMNEVDGGVEGLKGEESVVFLVGTAGQGEFPGNAREFWKSLSGAGAGGEVEGVKYGVFALGDSHYWPLPEDAHYFCKAGKDLDAKLNAVGFERLVPCGLGDDQAADGYMTAYNAWIPQFWESLGVDVEVAASSTDTGVAAGELPPDELIKEASNYLRGTIAAGLLDTSTGALTPLDTKLTKFHGIYQQDDRDVRPGLVAQGLEPAYSFMIRVRVPGGVATAEQWLRMDDIAGEYANGTIKLTTRQAFQFHGVVKRELKKTIQEINQACLDTIAACGDVNRNVMCTTVPYHPTLHSAVIDFARAFS
ncbi:hypothetical protein HK102_005656, partial [Quaeritorhiza haematococci]